MFLLELALKTSLVLAASGLAALVLARASAASRHAVWIAGLAATLAVAVGMFALPRWAVAVSATVDVVRPVAVNVAPAAIVLDQLPTAVEQVVTKSASATRVPAIGAIGVWLVGAGVLFLRLAAGEIGIRRLARRSAPASDARIRARLEHLQRSLGLSRPVTLLFAPGECVPVTWGTTRPVILLPPSAASWPATRLDVVLSHELAHVIRRDVLWSQLGRAAVATCWVNPLVWIAARQMRKESERACDDAVLRCGMRASEYADELVALARSLGGRRPIDAAAPAMFGRSPLEMRISSVLAAGIARGRASSVSAAVAVALVVTALPLSALTPVATTESAIVAQGVPPPPPPPKVVPAPPEAPPPPPPRAKPSTPRSSQPAPPPPPAAPTLVPPPPPAASMPVPPQAGASPAPPSPPRVIDRTQRASSPHPAPPPPPPPVHLRPDFNGTWVALDVERADKLFEVGLSMIPGRVTIAQDPKGIRLSATFQSGSIALTHPFDGSPTTGEGRYLTWIKSRASMENGQVTVENYRGAEWVSQSRYWIQGDQLIVEFHTASNTVTAIYRKVR